MMVLFGLEAFALMMFRFFFSTGASEPEEYESEFLTALAFFACCFFCWNSAESESEEEEAELAV